MTMRKWPDKMLDHLAYANDGKGQELRNLTHCSSLFGFSKCH